MNHVLCDGGLCNRLNALLFALVLKRKFGHDWSISWPRNSWCGAALSDLFVPPLPVDEHGIEHYKQHEQDHLLLMHENQLGFDPARLVLNGTLEGFEAFRAQIERAESQGQGVVYYHHLLPAFVEPGDVREALRMLTPALEVQRIARAFCIEHGIDKDVIGLHIRKTDFGDKVNDRALFEQARSSPRRFFVCSDDAEVNARFATLPNCAVFEKTSFPQKVQEDAAWLAWTRDHEGRTFPFNITRPATSVVEGLVDLLILSRTEMVNTSGSTFLATARLFKSCNYFQPAAAAAATAAPVRTPDTPPTAGKTTVNEQPVTLADIFELLNLIRPWQMTTDVKVRIGSDADGGYVMPSVARKSNAVLSIGIGNEVSFDDELAGLGARVHQFDHTIAGSPSHHPLITFHKQGWGAKDEEPFVSLRSMAALIDWSTARHAILKFDTEGAEWDCLGAASSEDIARFEILTGEFHDFAKLVNREHYDQVFAVFSKLAATHRVVHLHANNAGGMVMLGGLPFPRLLELTYVRIGKIGVSGHSAEPIPGPLDRPNVPQLPDLILRAF